MTSEWIEEHARIRDELIASGVDPDEANLQACALATEALGKRLMGPMKGGEA